MNQLRLGKGIKISPKANISVYKAGLKKEFFVETVSLLIGIGNDHTAELIMTKEAWLALNNDEAVIIVTNEDFKNSLNIAKTT